MSSQAVLSAQIAQKKNPFSTLMKANVFHVKTELFLIQILTHVNRNKLLSVKKVKPLTTRHKLVFQIFVNLIMNGIMKPKNVFVLKIFQLI